MKALTTTLVILGSIATIGFGIWHLFVPKIWDWYSYIQSEATELILAVRAINVFFSVSLILFGVINAVLILSSGTNKLSLLTVLGATSILWLVRVVLQIVYPQGSMNPALRYGMLCSFVVIFLCYAVSFVLVMRSRNG
jgi:hypothetical protein